VSICEHAHETAARRDTAFCNKQVTAQISLADGPESWQMLATPLLHVLSMHCSHSNKMVASSVVLLLFKLCCAHTKLAGTPN